MGKTVTQQKFYSVLGTIWLVVAVILVAAAIGAKAGRDFADSQVRDQLVQEKISFPPAGSAALDPKEFPGLQQYAGQPVDSGIKAKAYANEFIWRHMMKASGGKTYAEVSAESMANPSDQKLATLKNILFQGDMLRSSLLTAYAFSVFGVLAGLAYPAALAAATVMFAVSLLSFLKSRRG